MVCLGIISPIARNSVHYEASIDKLIKLFYWPNPQIVNLHTFNILANTNFLHKKWAPSLAITVHIFLFTLKGTI